MAIRETGFYYAELRTSHLVLQTSRQPTLYIGWFPPKSTSFLEGHLAFTAIYPFTGSLLNMELQCPQMALIIL